MRSITLYGAPFSLFTGRARSYLIKSGIDYREEPHASKHFFESILPKAGGRRGIPTIEFPNGEVIRDGVAIIDHFEALNGEAFSPKTPKQQIVSLILDAIGAEGLLRPCMHYRWNFDHDNKDFLLFHFQTIFMEEDPEQAAKDRMKFITEEVNPAWGVTPETHEFIEAHHLGTLKKLNAHFAEFPYFLGGKPCRGDFGMMAPLYGHLGRDPKPLALMQFHAVRLFRWTERMNRPEPDVGEFANKEEVYLPADEVPQTLIDALKHFAIDFMPETRAACRCINAWLEDNKELPAGTEVERGVGTCHFEVDGVQFSAVAQPFRFYVLKRMQDAYEAMSGDDKRNVHKLLAQFDMGELLDLKLNRGIGRANNLEVWQ
ncbi:MAG: glutathione S-transferase N-terminal domain-containing protein [Pseudomonadales bacterium]